MRNQSTDEPAARKPRKGLRDPKAFRRTLAEEAAVISAGHDLPLSVLALRIGGGWPKDAVRRVSDTPRTADLVCLPRASEPLVAPPNTKEGDAKVVGERPRSTVPEAALGAAVPPAGNPQGS